MYKYGTDMCLMDATYRFSLYDIPLFQLCVPTNVGYFVVATFITEQETIAAISEALALLSKACPAWKPKAFMIDNDESEIKSLESVFPGTLAQK